MEFLYWIICYGIPAGIAAYFKNKEYSDKNRVLIIHGFVMLSAILLTVLSVRLSWNIDGFGIIALAVGILLSFYFLRVAGLLYSASSIIQEYCLLMAGVLLSQAVSIWIAAVATSLMFALTHYIGQPTLKKKVAKFGVIFMWGALSILLYYWLEQPLYNIAAHIVGGAILINKNFLYQTRSTN